MGHRRRLPATMRSLASTCRPPRGFTLVELLVVMTLGTMIAVALFQVMRFQQRIYREQRATASRHDALRLASSVLALDLLEASGREGDFASLGTDNITIRSPVGFAVVCAVDPSNKKLGLFDVSGRVNTTVGDSLLLYHPNGWLVRAIQDVDPQGASSLTCPYGAGPSIEMTLRVDGSVTGVPVGAPVRAFRRHTYRLEQDRGSWWLARDDGSGAEILAGPFSGDGSGLAFAYFTEDGQPTTDPARVARVDLTLVAVSGNISAKSDTLTASIRPRNQ